MPDDCISYKSSGYFSPLITDYLDQKEHLQPLYNRFPTLENFEGQIREKQENFPPAHREILVDALHEQYEKVAVSALTRENISLLEKTETFTITTGHQLNLFTGPLYFLYKIISAINLAKELKQQYPAQHFVPVYWMATEDHDFEEINYFNFHGKKFRWNKESSGPVGRLSTDGLEEFLNVFALELGIGTQAEIIKSLFREAYLQHATLADATRYLANALFGKYGLVIIDGDHTSLKRPFIPYVKEELLHQISYKKVSEAIDRFQDYNIQVNPREINLFFIEDNLRERIIFQDGMYLINNTALQFSEVELLELLEKHPEKFSPNVVLRPLYQEVILPNLCYIGGGGELAYWLELKSFFDEMQVAFPILLLRNSVLIASEKQARKADHLHLSWQDLFSKPAALINKKVREFSEFSLDFTPQKEALQKQFGHLNAIAGKTDQSFTGAVKAQEAKQIKGLENLEKKLLKAEKKKHAEALERLAKLQMELFPNNSLQERFANFSEFYIENDKLIEKLLSIQKPLSDKFNILVL